MGSVHFDIEAGPLSQGVNDFANSIVGSSDFTMGAWIREKSYAADFASCFSFNGAPGHASILMVDCNETSPGDLTAFLQDGSSDTLLIKTGSFTGWIAVAFRHVGGTSDYEVLYRLEGDTSMTSAGTLNIGSEANLGWLRVANDDLGDPTDTDVRAFFANQVAMSDGDIYDLFQNYQFFDGSGFKVFLPLLRAATVLHNDGIGGDWTRQDGTPTDEVSQPIGPVIQANAGFAIADTLVIAFNDPITSGGAIVVGVGGNDVDLVITDDGGNTYLLGSQATDGIGERSSLYYAVTGLEPGNITIVATGATFVTATIAECPPASGARDGQGDQHNTGPLTVDLAMEVGDFVFAYANALSNSNVESGEVDGLPAAMMPISGLTDFGGFNYSAVSSGTLTLQIISSDEGGVFGGIAALSLIPNSGTGPRFDVKVPQRSGNFID